MSYVEFDSLESHAPVFLELKTKVEIYLKKLTAMKGNVKPIAIVGLPHSGRQTLARFIQKHATAQPLNLILNVKKYQNEQIFDNQTIYIFDYLDENFNREMFEEVFINPSLVERKEDLICIAEFHLQVFSLMMNKGKMIMSEKAKEKILAYPWLGQFTEFEQVIENAVSLCSKNIIEPEHLILKDSKEELHFSVGQKLENIERQYILQTLFFVQQNRTRAAEVLGISIRTLRNKLNQYRQEGFL